MADLFAGAVPVEEKIAVLEREVAMRRQVYPRLVAAGRMKQSTADRGVEVMLAILADYRGRTGA